jgi:anti-anti-sigma regulatory factor
MWQVNERGCSFNRLLMSAASQAAKRKQNRTTMLNVTIENLGDAAVLHCVGRVVAGTALAAMRETTMCHLASQPVVLDFSDVTAIDASGLGTLVFLHTCAYGIGVS